ncbi:MAG: hypothetical protein HYY01_14655 [Chloroflexi bacterium]|nr:hypothetical protein [Chloroflexota bacterium]
MEIRILGAHNLETSSTRQVSILVDDVLALDAGALTSSLSLAQQASLQSLLLTHSHHDHIKDVAALSVAKSYLASTVNVYASGHVIDMLRAHIWNEVVFPDFTKLPSVDTPAVKLHLVEPYRPQAVAGYDVMAMPVDHTPRVVGYQVTSGEGKSFFYTGGTLFLGNVDRLLS